MIDLHTHILPGVDDGADSEKEAMNIVRKAKKQGITKMVATPHYLDDTYQLSPTITKSKIKQLQQKVDQKNLGIEILPGAEVFITPDLGKKIKNNEIMTINDSHYLLIEFPADHIPKYADEVFYDLKVLGYKPIICHPERNDSIISNPNQLYKWVKKGIYAQVNASSLVGVFGSKVKEIALALVKHNLVQFIASDVHSTDKRKQYLAKGLQIIEDINSAKKYMLKNAQKVIADKDIEILTPNKITPVTLADRVKSFFSST